jgi:hypothetical protein
VRYWEQSRGRLKECGELYVVKIDWKFEIMEAQMVKGDEKFGLGLFLGRSLNYGQ